LGGLDGGNGCRKPAHSLLVRGVRCARVRSVHARSTARATKPDHLLPACQVASFRGACSGRTRRDTGVAPLLGAYYYSAVARPGTHQSLCCYIQLTVFFFHTKSVVISQQIVFFSHNKSAPATTQGTEPMSCVRHAGLRA